jgi:phage terminase large subunit
VQNQQISITKRSLNIIKEYRNYLYLVEKNGNITNTPAPGNDHHMDGLRYAMTSLVPEITRAEMMARMPRYEDKPKQNPAI